MSDLVDLFEGRPGWRLEPRSTPGASSLWCFVSGGKIEFSVNVDRDGIHLYEMGTDREIVFKDADDLTDWFKAHRADALQEKAAARTKRSRFREFTDWG